MSARTVRRARLKDQKRLALKMRTAAERGNAIEWDRLVGEAQTRGYITPAQVQELAKQRAYLKEVLAKRNAELTRGDGFIDM